MIGEGRRWGSRRKVYLGSWEEKQENFKSEKYTEQKKTNEQDHFKAREVEKERGKPVFD